MKLANVMVAVASGLCVWSFPQCSFAQSVLSANTGYRLYSCTALGADSISPGSTISVFGVDGSVYEGEFRGLQSMQNYAERYKDMMHTSDTGTLMPEIGDSVQFFIRGKGDTKEIAGKLAGFDRRVILLHCGSTNDTTYLLVKVVDSLRSARVSLSGDTLRTWMKAGRIPLISGLLLEEKDNTNLIPVDRIKRIQWLVSDGSGTVIPIVAAVVAVGVTIYALSKWNDAWKHSLQGPK